MIGFSTENVTWMFKSLQIKKEMKLLHSCDWWHLLDTAGHCSVNYVSRFNLGMSDWVSVSLLTTLAHASIPGSQLETTDATRDII